MLLSDGWLEEFQQCIIRKYNGHTWRYDYSHTPWPCRLLVTASLCFRGLFFWDALYTRNRDSERSMINATILERRFERRLQTRFDYGYWNVILLLEKVINAPTERSMINTTTRERRFETRFESRFDCGYWNEFLQPRCDLKRVWARNTFL